MTTPETEPETDSRPLTPLEHITALLGDDAFLVPCPERRWQPLPITEVHNQLEGLMLELFGVSKCHGIQRNEKNQRGFRGVKLRGVADLWADTPTG